MLEVRLAGIELGNPTMLASGILGTSAASLIRVARAGAGAVVAKSVGLSPREGHRNPTVIEVEQGVLNAVGLSNPGVEEFAEELRQATSAGVPVVASVYGFRAGEYAEVARRISGAGVAAVELNLSCPNVEKVGALFGADEDLAFEVVREVKRAVSLPVFAKLTANAGDIVAIAKACEEGGADAITAINTVKAMAIDTRAKAPVLGNEVGGLSGPCIKPIALRCVYEIAREVSIPVIGCGGIATGEDAVEFLLAGARAVQIGTAVLSRGVSVFRKVSLEIKEYLEERGYESVEEIVGLALRC
ncbi:MAG: dihydroorotate dehydrogenase [Euryarchaeota archaeon]|nr:dihydroorotate dehydrogenase [Euryarchaeota archaeon]